MVPLKTLAVTTNIDQHNMMSPLGKYNTTNRSERAGRVSYTEIYWRLREAGSYVPACRISTSNPGANTFRIFTYIIIMQSVIRITAND